MKKTRTITKTLKLSKQTVRSLVQEQLRHVAGAATTLPSCELECSTRNTQPPIC